LFTFCRYIAAADFGKLKDFGQKKDLNSTSPIRRWESRFCLLTQ
jgi:hypothetical protein